MKRIWDEIGPPVFGIVALIVVWAIVAALTDTRGVPSPAEVWSAFLTGMRDGTIPEATVKTLLRLLFAFACSIAIGVAIGVGMALNEFARRSVRPLIVALQITPFVAWLPLAVVWFGASERAVVFVTIVGAFPSVTLATMSAIRQVPPILTRAGRTMGAEGWALYRDVILPAAHARLRRWAAAGVGLRVEGPDGRRAHHHRGGRLGPGPSARRGTEQRARAAWPCSA